MYTQTAYRCSFCHKTGLSKSNIVKHEERCFKNPVTRSCATCANLSSSRVINPFSIEYSPVKCLVGIVFEKKQGEDIPVGKSLKLKTECGKWVEKSDDIEELIAYQDSITDAVSIIMPPYQIENEQPF